MVVYCHSKYFRMFNKKKITFSPLNIIDSDSIYAFNRFWSRSHLMALTMTFHFRVLIAIMKTPSTRTRCIQPNWLDAHRKWRPYSYSAGIIFMWYRLRSCIRGCHLTRRRIMISSLGILCAIWSIWRRSSLMILWLFIRWWMRWMRRAYIRDSWIRI